jgi:hypothetical protein
MSINTYKNKHCKMSASNLDRSKNIVFANQTKNAVYTNQRKLTNIEAQLMDNEKKLINLQEQITLIQIGLLNIQKMLKIQEEQNMSINEKLDTIKDYLLKNQN